MPGCPREWWLLLLLQCRNFVRKKHRYDMRDYWTLYIFSQPGVVGSSQAYVCRVRRRGGGRAKTVGTHHDDVTVRRKALFSFILWRQDRHLEVQRHRAAGALLGAAKLDRTLLYNICVRTTKKLRDSSAILLKNDSTSSPLLEASSTVQVGDHAVRGVNTTKDKADQACPPAKTRKVVDTFDSFRAHRTREESLYQRPTMV